MNTLLPPAFADLEPFVLPWIKIDTMEGRYLARQDMPFETLKSFYAAIAPRLAEIMTHLDRFAAESLPVAETNLFRLALGLIEAAQAVEFFGTARLPRAPCPHLVAVGGQAASSI